MEPLVTPWLGTVLSVGSALLVSLARVIELRTKRQTVPGIVKETSSLRMFIAVGTFGLSASVLEFVLRGCRFGLPLFVLGWMCSLGSFWLRRGAITALGKFWSLHVEIRNSHALVQSGPFRWVRHPAYLSIILELVAVCAMLQATITLPLTLLLVWPVMLQRIRTEESALVQKLGSAYIAYRERTPAILPFRWPRPA